MPFGVVSLLSSAAGDAGGRRIASRAVQRDRTGLSGEADEGALTSCG